MCAMSHTLGISGFVHLPAMCHAVYVSRSLMIIGEDRACSTPQPSPGEAAERDVRTGNALCAHTFCIRSSFFKMALCAHTHFVQPVTTYEHNHALVDYEKVQSQFSIAKEHLVLISEPVPWAQRADRRGGHEAVQLCRTNPANTHSVGDETR